MLKFKKLYDPPPYDGHNQFELELDVKLDAPDAQIMYVGETDTYLLVKAEDYKIVVTYADRSYGPTEQASLN